MKKLLFALFATFISTNATAEWTRVGGDDDKSSDIYVDVNTVRKTGGKAKIWSLGDYKTLQGNKNEKYSSAKMYWEFDCQEENLRILALSAYSKKMGSGGVVFSENTPYDNWQPVAPESTGGVLLSIACKEAAGEQKWTEVERNTVAAKGLADATYVDYGTVIKRDGFTTVWYLIDFKSNDPTTQYKNFSIKALREYDCNEARTRVRVGLVYLGNMGIGKESVTENAYDWSPVTRGSFHETFTNIFCEKSLIVE